MTTNHIKTPGEKSEQDTRQREERVAAIHRLSDLIDSGELKEDILKRIDKGNELPIAPATWNTLIRLTASADRSVTDLSNIILGDYGLTSKVLKLVNSVHYMRFGEVTTVSRAILLLGLETIKNMAITMSLFGELQKAQSSYLTGLLTKAIYAALVGQALSTRMSYPNPEEAFLGSLFGFLGEILAAYYAPNRYGEIRTIVKQENDPAPGGMAHRTSWFYRDIGLSVARTWGLPGKMIVCMRPITKSTVSSKADIDRLHCICTIAYNVAEISERESTEEIRKRRIEEHLDFYGHYYEVARTDIDEIRTASAKDVQKYCSAYEIDFQDTPIGEGIYVESEQDRETNSEELIEELQTDFLESMQGETGSVEEAENPEIIFANGMRDIARALLEDYQMDDIFTIIMETVYRGLRPIGIVKIMLLIRNTKKPVMDVRLALGDSTVALRKWFVVPIDQKEEDFFNIALNRQTDLLIKDTSAKAASRLIPGWLADALREPAFLMALPITVKEKSIGMIYIEGRREALPAIQPSHLHYLKVLHDQAVLAIRKKSGV
jgi:HD-like signal output (HDOD) protein